MARRKSASGSSRQQAGPSLAQSGGKNSSFGGGKGGTALTRGVTSGAKLGRGMFNSGTSYNIRGDGGNATRVPFKGRVGKPPPVHPGGKGITQIIKSKIRKPEGYSGGSN